jgi:hypothetical protein
MNFDALMDVSVIRKWSKWGNVFGILGKGETRKGFVTGTGAAGRIRSVLQHKELSD